MKPFFFFGAILLCSMASVWADDPNPPSISSTKGAWPLARQWNVAETHHFAEWIENIYRVKSEGTDAQRLAKLERVLTDPEMNLLLDPAFAGERANPQLDSGTIRAMHSVLDCGKLTVALSTYYAYRRGLPWMQTYVCPANGGDLRTTDYNIPSGCICSWNYDSAHAFFVDAITGLCTGNFRVELNRRNSEMSDTLPVAIDKRYLIPGCLFYLDGHVLVVADVDKYGEPHFLDSTTAITRDIFAHNGLNAVTGMVVPTSTNDNDFSGCYRGFRLQRFPIAETDAGGNVLRVRRRTDAEMAEFGYSIEQYEKLRELTKQGAISEAGLALDNFHEFIRLKLKGAERATPVADLKAWAEEAQAFLNNREERVQRAWQDVRAQGPIAFPEGDTWVNVFTAGGRWGEHSTAAIDANFREQYFELVGRLDHAIRWLHILPEYVDMEGLPKKGIWSKADMAVMLVGEKRRIFAKTKFTYKNSKGEPVTLSLLDIEDRLYDLSFDPNQAPELRWGAKPGSKEAETAIEMGTPVPGGAILSMKDAYDREAYYRSLAQRETEPSYLRNGLTTGFPVRAKMDEDFFGTYCQKFSPPLVPHKGLAQWVKEQHQVMAKEPESVKPANKTAKASDKKKDAA